VKPVALEELAADPLAEARATAGTETVTVKGLVRSIDANVVALCTSPECVSFVEYPRPSVVAAFRDQESSEITLLVKADTNIRVVTMARARASGGGGCQAYCAHLMEECLGRGDPYGRCNEIYLECMRACGMGGIAAASDRIRM
jgi:hypothetical protein